MKKNVLFIVVDQWRADFVPHIMRAGGREPFLATPNLDRICREGVTFRNHVTTAVPCGPARASLLTGLYLMNHRAAQNCIPLDARHTNLALALRDIGYDPALVGYTTSTPDPRVTSPNDPSYLVLGDVMPGFRPVGTFEPNMEAYFGWIAQQGFDLPKRRENIWLPEGEDSVPGATDRPSRIPKEYSDTAFFTDRALTYLKGRGGKPFFLHLGYYRPHPPFVAPAPYHQMFAPASMPKPVRAPTWQEEAAQHPLLDFYLRKTAQASFFEGAQGQAHDLSESEIMQMRATYCGLIREVDDQIGRIFDWLDETGQWDDTLIIFTSDHAEQLGDHYLLGKVGYFDESFRIPLVIRDPSRRELAGAIEDNFTESVDVMPTVLEWLGGEVPRACDGRSLLPLLQGEKPSDWRTELHYEYDFRDIFYSQAESTIGVPMDHASLCVVQDAAFKYVHFAALPPLLFDLKLDPHQFRNVARDPGYRDAVLLYAQKALTWRMQHAERTLTHYRSSPQGLQKRSDDGGVINLRNKPLL